MPITPGTLGGMGRMPGSMGGGQFGGAAGGMGGRQNQNPARRRRLTGAPLSQITPGVLGGGGVVPTSVSPITPGSIGDASWKQDLGNRFDAAVGSMSQPSPITPGVLGGGGVAPTFNPTGSGAFGGAFGGMDPGGGPVQDPGQGQFGGAAGTMGPMEPPVADERSRQMDMARDWQMGINKNPQIGGVPVDPSQMWKLVEARNRMAAGGGDYGGPAGLFAPPPPGFPGGISSPGFRGWEPPGQGREGDFSRQRTWDTPTPWTPPGQGFEGEFSRQRPQRPTPDRYNPELAGQFGGRMGRPQQTEADYQLGMAPGGFPGRPPMRPGMFPPGFRGGPPGMFPPGFRGGRPGMFPPGGFPGRYPAWHPRGGGMGLEQAARREQMEQHEADTERRLAAAGGNRRGQMWR